jgi:tetratricopeptide (TPR) repeat protein
MSIKQNIIKQLLAVLTVSIFLVGPLFAQTTPSSAQSENDRVSERDRRDNKKTKKSQAVSKSVYAKITKAQELMETEDNDGALKILNALRASTKISDYERQNVMNYLGFVYYNMEDIPRAMSAYQEMLRIPTIEEQIKKTTTYTLAQLNTMEENYSAAISLIEEYLKLEINPTPDAYILYAQNLYQIERYGEMIEPIETALVVDVRRKKAQRAAAVITAEAELKKAREELEIAADTQLA